MSADTATKPTGKAFNLNLIGDDLHLYTTMRDIYQDEREADESRVLATLDGLDPEIRALLQARMAAKPVRRDISHREVFVRAMREAMAAREAADDEAELLELEAATAPNGASAHGADTEA